MWVVDCDMRTGRGWTKAVAVQGKGMGQQDLRSIVLEIESIGPTECTWRKAKTKKK